ncbi:MAG TPA: hypothetical protein PK127_06090 [Clostridiales bacterium]|nr:hypothetical protein [Clostridiales bacterium]HPV02028.1 hypothetical protein [Clostridiales bacterium]
MKKIKTIYKWILISVILQTAFLSWLNYVYLPNRGHFKSTMYEMDFPAVKNRSYRLPEGADHISVSFDGLYAAYMLDGKLIVVDIDSGREIRRLDSAGGVITFNRWLPDREMLIYAIKEPEGKSGRVRISTYDVIPDLDRSYPDIKGLPGGSAVVGIELSPMTNIVYPKIQTSDTRARIYRFDIMDNLSLIFKTDLTTVIKETLYTDNLVYQPAGERTRVRNGQTGKTTYIPVKSAHLLLEIDGRDMIYAGITDKSGNVTEIRYGKAGSDAGDWESINLDMAVSADDIIITPDGSVYVVDRDTRTVECVKRGNGRKDRTDVTSDQFGGLSGQTNRATGSDYGESGHNGGTDSSVEADDRKHESYSQNSGLADWLNGLKDRFNGSDPWSDTAPQDRRLTRYEGRLITLLDQYIVYLDGQNLVFRTLEK